MGIAVTPQIHPQVADFIDKPRKDRRNESLEADPFGIDGRLIGVNGLNDRVHLRLQESALT